MAESDPGLWRDGKVAPHQPPTPLATPSHGAGGLGSFTVACGTRIAAPPERCLDVVLDAASYPQWNRFCRACFVEEAAEAADALGVIGGSGGKPTGRLQRGDKFVFDVHMDLDEEAGSVEAGDPKRVTGRATALEISVLERVGGGEEGPEAGGKDTSGWRVAWRTRGVPGMALRSERVQEFVRDGEGGGTAYRCWETFYGFLAPAVRLAVGAKLERGFGAWTDDLKKQAEG